MHVDGQSYGRALRAAASLVLLCAAAASAQEPDQVRDAVRRRTESWYRERSPRRVSCSRCSGADDRRPSCYTCDGTGLDLLKICKKVLPKFMRPSSRGNAVELEQWFRQAMKLQPTWGLLPFSLEGVVVEDVFVGRDTACVTVVWRDQRIVEPWAREGREFWLGFASGDSPDLIAHEWFVAGTFSLPRAIEYLERLMTAELVEGLTDLERARAQEDREAREQELRARLVADRGLIRNVSRVVHEEDGRVAYDVTVWSGLTDVRIMVVPGPRHGEGTRSLEDRLAALSRGVEVVFRGRLDAWERSPEGQPSLLSLADGQIRAADDDAPPLPEADQPR